MKVQLNRDTDSTIEHIGGFVTQFPANVQVFGSGDTRELVAFTRGCFIDIVNWRTKAHATIAAHTDELDELVRLFLFLFLKNDMNDLNAVERNHWCQVLWKVFALYQGSDCRTL